MRPLRLKLQGFVCFSDPVEIDFSAMDVFVICGPTGSGKTTLIDAMCYALYGRVPRQEGTTTLISHNRDSMKVSLEFSNSGRRYRVHREINTSRKTGRDGREKVTRLPSVVQLERRDGDEWTPLEGRVRPIDDEIRAILGLDFDGFTRCVLLPQGRFQEFLAGDRTRRRSLLVELLDLSIYERVGQAARQRGTRHADKAEDLQRRLDEDYADATEDALEASEELLREVGPQMERAVAERDGLQQAVELAVTVADARRRERDRRLEHDDITKKIPKVRELAQTGEQRVAGLEADVKSAAERQADLAYDARLHRQLQTARNGLATLHRLEADAASAKKAAADTSALDAAEKAVTKASKALEAAEKELAAAEEEVAGAHRTDAAAHVRQGLKPGDMCPVCGGRVEKLPLIEEGNVAAAERRYKAAQAAVKAARSTEQQAVGAAASARAAHDTAQGHVRTLETQLLGQREELEKSLPEGLSFDEAAIDAAFAAQEEAASRHEQLSTEIERLREEIRDLQPKVAESRQDLATLTAKADQLLEECERAAAEAEETGKALMELAREWAWQEASALMGERKNPRDWLSARLRQRQEEVDRLTRQEENLRRRVDEIRQKMARAAELREELAGERKRADLYGELANLLRANQFPDFVIEEAMEMLAASATEHLRNLFDRFRLQVAGGEFQVVDTWQGDQVRSARTLSGGETFVASLALALALAERLPELRQAVASSLESLFLDEGFGTLDPETLDTVISALEGLRSEERMVGIVTHVPELAQRIETRIEVQKSREGSSVTVIGA